MPDGTPARSPVLLRPRPAIAIAYDLPGLGSVDGILDIVVTDGLGLENGIARLRVLIAAASSATRLLETAEFEERLAAVETAIAATPVPS